MRARSGRPTRRGVAILNGWLRSGRDTVVPPVWAVLLATACIAGEGEEPASGTEGSGAERSLALRPPTFSLADSMEHWYAVGFTAHQLCSGLWVVGRDYQRSIEEVLAQDVRPFPHFHWMEDYTYAVDETDRSVTVRAPGVDPRTARYNGDQGCAILAAGAEQVYFEPLEVTPNLPDPDLQDWPTGDRNARGGFPEVNRPALESVLEWAFDDEALDPPQNTRGLVIVYRGKIVGERYEPGWGPHTPQLSWSMGKSIASALTGVMIQGGYYSLDDRAPIEEWQGKHDPRRNIRIRDLLRMSSGLDFDYFGLSGPSSYVAANEHIRIYFDALNAYLHSINQPLRFEPGTVWRYRNSDPLSLMLIVRRALEEHGENFMSFPQRHLFDRIGIRSMVLETDPWGNFLITGRDFGSTRDWARFALLHLQEGVWEGERILPQGWTDFVSTPTPSDPSQSYGGLFWLNRGKRLDRVPRDAYWASGHMGQTAMIIPSREMVIVRHGPSGGESQSYLNRLVGQILDTIGTP